VDDVNLPQQGTVRRRWTGTEGLVECRIHAIVPAREIWNRLLRASYRSSEPGVLFVDTINRENNLGWHEHLTATNPCGEIPLPPYGACNLGSVNLAGFVQGAFTAGARLDRDGVRSAVADAVRFLDDVIDASRYPLPQQQEQAHRTRRLGLGITGLADALIMLGLRYDSAEARELAAQTMRLVCETAYAASTDLAALKGPYPAFDRERCLAQPFVARLSAELRDRIAAVGLRNSHLTTIAPAGTISLLAGNVSSGIEPVFELQGTRRVIDHHGNPVEMGFTDFAYRQWQALHPALPPPDSFVTATRIEPEAHLLMQAALQPWVDAAISKTINLPTDFPFESYPALYERAHALGLKGCTTYRPGTERGQVISLERPAASAELADVERCCTV
jgi:ribonucleoside-diphosphate reductase alpha chain